MADLRNKWIWIAMAMLGAACSHAPRGFPATETLWQDPDREHVSTQPQARSSTLVGDALDQTVLRPWSDFLAFSDPLESINVNSLDEVPDSSWFVNRIGRVDMTPAEVARGSCQAPSLDPQRGPWLITRAKTEGINPGFFIKAPDGFTYLLKFDGSHRPQRETVADVIGSKLYFAAGYHAPCNEIVYFRRNILQLDPAAVTVNEFGEKIALAPAAVERALAHAFRLKTGELRASASRFLPGIPLGPHQLEGTRLDDPNDIIAHENRRELRAVRLLAAWFNNFDTREQNSLDMFVEEDGRRFVRHYMIDFGHALASPWDDRLDRRVGHSYYFDIEHIVVDMLSLGLMPRPWTHARINDEAEIFGYFDWQNFTPSKWRSVYPHPAHARMTFRDALWMVRIIARFSDAQLYAVVKTGRLHNARHEQYLFEALRKRRDLITEEYLQKHVPLDRFRLLRRQAGNSAQSLCFEDLAIRHAGANPAQVLYQVKMMAGPQLDQRLGWLQFQPDPDHPDRSCVLLPLGDRSPGYGVLRIDVRRRSSVPPTAIEVHLFDHGLPRGQQIVGLDRLN